MSETRDSSEGEILKASGPGTDQVRVGMTVTSLDGERLGTIKEVRGQEFLLNRPLARDLWVPLASVMATGEHGGKYRGGPTQPTHVVLNVSEAHVDRQGWQHA
jgi:hypothetical protein